MKIQVVRVREIDAVILRIACDIRRACKPTFLSPISPSISVFGVNAATESITMMSIAPELINCSAMSRACSPQSGWAIQRLLTSASYWNYQNVTHAVCCAHLLRELTGITENHPEQKWASAFTDFLLAMKKVRDKAVEKGKDSLSYYYYHKFDKKYDELIEQARKENPLPETTEKKRGRKKKGKILALVERLANYKAVLHVQYLLPVYQFCLLPQLLQFPLLLHD